MTRAATASSRWPRKAAPRQMRLTRTPSLPSCTYSIAPSVRARPDARRWRAGVRGAAARFLVRGKGRRFASSRRAVLIYTGMKIERIESFLIGGGYVVAPHHRQRSDRRRADRLLGLSGGGSEHRLRLRALPRRAGPAAHRASLAAPLPHVPLPGHGPGRGGERRRHRPLGHQGQALPGAGLGAARRALPRPHPPASAGWGRHAGGHARPCPRRRGGGVHGPEVRPRPPHRRRHRPHGGAGP